MTSKNIITGGILAGQGTQALQESKGLDGCQWQETASLITFINPRYWYEFASV